MSPARPAKKKPTPAPARKLAKKPAPRPVPRKPSRQAVPVEITVLPAPVKETPRAPPLPPPVPAPAAPAPPSTDEHYPASSRRIRFLVFLGLFLLALPAAALALGLSPFGLLEDTIFFIVPTGVAVILVGYVERPANAAVRLATALLVAAIVYIGILAGDPLFSFAENLFLLLFPAWGALVVLGTARWRWNGTQLFGAALLLLAIWRPIYLSLYDLTQIFTATGALEPYTVTQLYTIVAIKFLREVGFVLIGLLFLLNRFPYVQKRPSGFDLDAVIDRLGLRLRYAWPYTLGLGGTALTLALVGNFIVVVLLQPVEAVSEAGADDTSVFQSITPLLVLLLSLAAGVGEELIFRGVLQPSFERAWRTVFSGSTLPWVLAIVCQAVLFGAVHAGYRNPLHVILPTMFGLLMGLVLRYWGLVPAIYAHTAIDILAFGIDASKTNAWLEPVLYTFLFLNLLAGIIVPILLLVSRYRDRRALKWLPAE